MYSVFLVDDEHIVLEGIRNKINWDGSKYSFAGEATDGELALSMIHDVKPDILITDIKMPFMDGLELAQALKKIQPWIKIIILSGHDEFEYAKKAISIGVEDYILKPFTPEDLLASLDKVALSLDKERKQFSDISRLKEELESTSILMKNNFLTNLVTSILETSEVMQKAQEYGIDLISRFYRVIVSDISQKNSEDLPDRISSEDFQQAHSRLAAYSKNKKDIISFFLGPRRFVCILKNNSREDIEEDSYAVADAIEHLVTQDLNCTVISAMGHTTEHLSHISRSYQDAEEVINRTKFWNKSRIINSDDLKKNQDENGTDILSLHDNDPLVDKLKYAGKNEIEKIVDQQLSLLKDNTGQFAVISSYLLVDMIMSVSKLIETLGGDIKAEMPEILQHSFVENAGRDEDTFRKETIRVLEKVLEYRDSRMQGKYGSVILKAKSYIEENYASQDTCLTTVAEEVAMSPNHFSTVFSQECGTTFIEYLTNVRIENAKKLLRETDMKGADIAYECGFSDPHYFSFIFKKNTGVSPREYKNSVLQTSGKSE